MHWLLIDHHLSARTLSLQVPLSAIVLLLRRCCSVNRILLTMATSCESHELSVVGLFGGANKPKSVLNASSR